MAIEQKQPNAIAQRNTIRQTFRQRRRALSSSEQISAARQLVEQAQKNALFAGTKKVGLYMTNDGELDTKPLISYLWENAIDVFLPVLHPFSDGHLLFLEYRSSTPMRANHYGILEPMLDCSKVLPIVELDTLLTPIVAFDEQGNRLGMGGGFYDRTLMHLVNNPKSKTKLIGLAHDSQKALSLPTEVWDIPLPYILTPTRFYICKK